MMARSASLVEAGVQAIAPRRALRVALGAVVALAGVAGLMLGTLVFMSAHPTHPVEIDGAIVGYREITINGSYARNELQLAHDAHTYTFDNRQFHPALPPRLYKDARIQIWVDQGTTNVLALTIYDQMGINPITYSTSAFDHPTASFYATEGVAAGLALTGVALLALGAVGALGRGKMRRPVAGSKGVPLSRPAQPVPMYHPQTVPTQPAAPSPAAPALAGGGAGATAIPTAQAATTMPNPNRRPASGQPSHPIIPGDLDQLPTQKMPAASAGASNVAVATPLGAPTLPYPPPPTAPVPVAGATSQPGSVVIEPALSPFAAWGVTSEPPQSDAEAQAIRPPALRPVAPSTSSPALPLMPPGSLPDFPTERMPAVPAPAVEDIADEPTRESDAIPSPDLGAKPSAGPDSVPPHQH